MRLCVIGLGRMGLRHIQIGKNLGFDICGVLDASTVATQRALKEVELPESVAYGCVDEMLRQAQPDGVVVATTAPSHCDYVCRAALSGVRYILCEKPMAVSLAECDRMIKTCERSGAALAVNHQMRFMGQYTLVKELIDTPSFGGLRSVLVAGSNFGLAMNGSHYFEMFRYLTGEQIEKVSCWLDADCVPNPRGPQYLDRSGQLRATTPSGQRLYMELGADQGHGLQVVYGCKRGQILVDELAGFLRLSHREMQYAELPSTRYGMPAVIESRQIPPADVIGPTEAVWRALLANESFPDAQCGRHAVACLVAANISGEQAGKSVRTDETLAIERAFPWA